MDHPNRKLTMSIPRRFSIPALLLVVLTLAGCPDPEPPPELLDEVAELTEERERLRQELQETEQTIQVLREELARVELPEDFLETFENGPPVTARDTLRARIRGTEARVEGLTTQLRTAQGRAGALQRRADSLEVGLDELTRRHTARIMEDELRIETLENRVDELVARTGSLEREIEVQEGTLGVLDSELHTAHYLVGTEEELRLQGVVRREGGARVLFLLWRRGEAVVPARGLDRGPFTSIDLREVTEIPLPRADARYRVVSRQDLAHLSPSPDPDGWIRGDALRITDPEAFWQGDRFLIVLQER